MSGTHCPKTFGIWTLTVAEDIFILAIPVFSTQRAMNN